jgi:hypothetical protein
LGGWRLLEGYGNPQRCFLRVPLFLHSPINK